nr:MAG TPA: hypothetical protein [Caudoviricetes sp.]
MSSLHSLLDCPCRTKSGRHIHARSLAKIPCALHNPTTKSIELSHFEFLVHCNHCSFLRLFCVPYRDLIITQKNHFCNSKTQKRFRFAKIFLKINPGAEQNNKLFVLFALVLSKRLSCKSKRDILFLLPK